MGLKSGFNKFLKENYPEVFETVHVSNYAYKRVAIDISLYMHKFKAINGEKWMSSFINLISCLRRNEVHCVFIFDGASPVEKENERNKRRDRREKLSQNLEELETALNTYYCTGIVEPCLIKLCESKNIHRRFINNDNSRFSIDIKWIEYKIQQKRNQVYNISDSDFERVRELFNILDVPYYTAPCEAEKMCSKLCIDGKVDAVLSEDSDVLAYGAPCFLSKIDTLRDICICVSYTKVLESLNMTELQFRDFCIMCGTDYNSNIPKIGIKNAFKFISDHKSIENIATNTYLNTAILNHVRVRELFTVFEDYGIDKVPYCGRPKFEDLEKFLNTYDIRINIERIKSDFLEKEIVFEDDQETQNN